MTYPDNVRLWQEVNDQFDAVEMGSFADTQSFRSALVKVYELIQTNYPMSPMLGDNPSTNELCTRIATWLDEHRPFTTDNTTACEFS